MEAHGKSYLRRQRTERLTDTRGYYGDPSGWFFRAGTLYAMINGAFAASSDDGQTWTILEQAATQPGAAYDTGITPGYRSPQTWLRVQTIIVNNSPMPQIERSIDGGRTWSVLPLQGLTSTLPAAATHNQGLSASLATNPAQPHMLCGAFSVADAGTSSHVGARIAGGPPPMPKKTLFLGRSTDDGATWQLAPIAQASDGAAVFSTTDGGASAILTDNGDCLAMTDIDPWLSQVHLDATLWRLPVGATQAESALTLPQWTVERFDVLAQASGMRIFVTATPSHVPQTIICTSDASCYDHFDQAHLLWHARL